ncbi:MAG: endonuclease/exonuclease/phosphatase family protein [Planctomycetota bacterium]|jgi:endonuclease/exonuclease/phosphatase family metal-dependent hydrolase
MTQNRPGRSGITAVRVFLGVIVALALQACATSAREPEPLRVMTFNVRYGTAQDGENRWELRDDLVVRVIRDFDPAVVGVQEALRFQLDELREALPAFHEIGAGRRDGREAGEYAAILYRHDRFEVLEQETFWFSDTPSVPGSVSWGNRITRICTWGRFRERRTRRSFYVFNVHWDHESQPSRVRSGELLRARVEARSHPDDPVIVTGDFNAGESNPAVRPLADAGLVDTFRVLHPDVEEAGTFNGFTGSRGGEKIDGIWVTPDWDVIHAAIDRTNSGGRYPSDHFPVTAVLRRQESR